MQKNYNPMNDRDTINIMLRNSLINSVFVLKFDLIDRINTN